MVLVRAEAECATKLPSGVVWALSHWATLSRLITSAMSAAPTSRPAARYPNPAGMSAGTVQIVNSVRVDLLGTVERTTIREIHLYKAHGPALLVVTGLSAALARSKDEHVLPNLTRIPSGGNVRAAQILRRITGPVTGELLDSLGSRDVLVLGRYGARQPAIALRTNSPARLHDALLATAICQSRRESDPRDVMVGMALHHHVARQMGLDPAAVFEQVAGCLSDGPIRELLRTFGDRNDVTLTAFGWRQVDTADGPDFVPTPSASPVNNY